ncbi:hypothetical protein AP053_gp128 [Ostreococcus mediterraneus virus 1]|jgi:hypothetical protein|uniref:hypothetical protein n=1 Tax=Ostreococcus mediterraneus virus 1 TaxID=1663210 RepID=UPI0006D2B1F1|nr:hypothetical protein AP053_gp128 [Ostreococcus mediterraneus virus 1]ALI95239.1 hypothetical protein OmV1_128c [Ostreococcus mediterraneus virus 1]
MMKKGRAQNLAMLAAVAVLVYLLFTMNNKSAYSIREREYSMIQAAPAAAGPAAAGPARSGCGMEKGTGLASSLLPREVASAEDFGEFAPEDILAGQNFLEPRQQIGFPESVGGALRNANQQIRAEPPNTKEPFVWNNSTIVPDGMMRSLC